MKHLFSLINGWAKALYSGRGWEEAVEEGREVADALLMEARKNNLMLKNSGTICGERLKSFAAVCSQRGEKGVNQDCSIDCEVVCCSSSLNLMSWALSVFAYLASILSLYCCFFTLNSAGKQRYS